MAQKTVELQVDGMTCQNCVRSVQKKLSGLPGVESANVDLEAKKATVVFDEARVQRPQLIGAIEQIGFEAS